MSDDVSIDGGVATIKICRSAHNSKYAVNSSIHRLTSVSDCRLTRETEDFWLVSISPKSSGDLVNLQTVCNDFFKHLVDYELREALRERTDGLRKLIIAHTFSDVSVFDPESDLSAAFEDPKMLSDPDVETGRVHKN